jgi:hypothetical protein
VPKQLSPDLKERRKELLGRYQNEGETLLQRTVTEEGSWTHHFQSQTDCEQREAPSEFTETQNITCTTSADKVMLTLFWNSEGADFGALHE